MTDPEGATREANDGNNQEEEEEELHGVVHVANPTGSANNAANGANSNSNEESLGEIWFDTMRRSRRQGGGGSNSTPSSPSDSCEQEQETSSDTSSAPKGEEQAGSDPQDPGSTDPRDNNTDQTGNEDKREEQDHKTASSRQGKRGGYQSDDEGGFHYNTSSGSGGGSSSDQGDNENGNEAGTGAGASTSSSSSYLDAVTLMGLHKKAQAEEKERLKQQEQEAGEPKKKKAKSLSSGMPKGPTTLAEQVAKLQATHNEISASSMAKKSAAGATSTGIETDINNPASKPTPPTSNATSITSSRAVPNTNNTEGTTKNPPQVRKLQRLERNAREKQRSGKITDQFQVLKQILTDSGVVVPKGTKGSILSIVHTYILNLRQQQRQKERDNEALKQQMVSIAQGSLGNQAARALHSAAQKNGLLQSLPPLPVTNTEPQLPQAVPPHRLSYDPLNIVREGDYHKVWDTCPVGIAVATMGGTFLDCNQVFRTLLKYSKSYLRTISLFHLLQAEPDKAGGKSNLQMAFEQISKLLETLQTPEQFDAGNPARPIVLPGSIQGHEHLGLGVSLIHSAKGNTNGLDGHLLGITLLQSGVDPATGYAKQFLPATLVALPPKTAAQQQQHALTTILTNSAPMNATASSSLSSSGSSNQNHNNNGGGDKQQQQQQQEQQKQQELQQQDPRYYTVG